MIAYTTKYFVAPCARGFVRRRWSLRRSPLASSTIRSVISKLPADLILTLYNVRGDVKFLRIHRGGVVDDFDCRNDGLRERSRDLFGTTTNFY